MIYNIIINYLSCLTTVDNCTMTYSRTLMRRYCTPMLGHSGFYTFTLLTRMTVLMLHNPLDFYNRLVMYTCVAMPNGIQ